MDIKVLALIGESGSGKTTIAEILRTKGYNVIDSYTTRPKRTEDETGHTFVGLKTLDEHQLKNCDTNGSYVVAYTYFDNHHYWTTIDQFKEGWNVYVIDTIGYKGLKLNDQLEVTGIYICVDEATRYQRLKKDRGFAAAIERLMHDRKAFKLVSCDYVINNSFGKPEDVTAILINLMEGKNE